MKKDTIIKIVGILSSIVILGIIFIITRPENYQSIDRILIGKISDNIDSHKISDNLYCDCRKISDNLYCKNQFFEDDYYKDRIDTETMQNYCNAISEYLDNKFPDYSFYIESVDTFDPSFELCQVLDDTVPIYEKPHNVYLLHSFCLYIEDNNVEEKYRTIDSSYLIDPTITIPNNIISNKSAIRKAKNYLTLHPYHSDRLIPASNTEATLIYERIEGKFVYAVDIKGSADTVYMDAISGEVIRISRNEWWD